MTAMNLTKQLCVGISSMCKLMNTFYRVFTIEMSLPVTVQPMHSLSHLLLPMTALDGTSP